MITLAHMDACASRSVLGDTSSSVSVNTLSCKIAPLTLTRITYL